MAANQLRAMYARRIGFTNGADDNIVDAQGIDSVRELGYLNDMRMLLTFVRRSAGQAGIFQTQPSWLVGP